MSDNFIAQPANPYYNRFVVQLFDFTCAYLRADEAEGACDQLMAVARDNGIGSSLPHNLADPLVVKAWWLKAIAGILVDERTIGHTNQTSHDLTDTAVHLARIATGTDVSRWDVVRAVVEHHIDDYIDDDSAQEALREAYGDDYNSRYDRLQSYDSAREACIEHYMEYQVDDDIASQYIVVGDGEYVVDRY